MASGRARRTGPAGAVMAGETSVVTEPELLVSAVLEGEARRQAEQDARSHPVWEVPDGLLASDGGEELTLGAVIRAGGAALIGTLTGLVLLDSMDNAAFSVLSPDIQRSLHVSDTSIGVIGALGGLLVVLAAIPMGVLGDRFRRTAVVGVSTVVWGGFALFTGAAHTVWQMLLARSGAGVGKANEGPVQNALLADGYPIGGRNRVYALHRAGVPAGLLVGPALAGGVAAAAGGSAGWRWAFPVLSVPAALFGLAALRLREPGRGRHEMEAVLGVDHDLGRAAGAEAPIPVGAAFARLKKIESFYYYMVALGVLGLAVIAAPIYVNLILKNHFHEGPAGRGLIGTLTAIGPIAGVVLAGTVGDRLFRRAPERSLLVTGALVAGYGLLTSAAVSMPAVWAYAVLAAVANGLGTAAFIPIYATVAAVTPYRLRSMGFATVGLYLSLFGGLGGALLIGTLVNSIGERGAVAVVTAPVSVMAGLIIVYGSRFLRRDMARAAADLVEEQAEARRLVEGGSAPLLQVRNLDFSYGSVQVLFDVNVDVWPGEVLALLGTNGAGKSTLLRAVSGLDYADRGVVRLGGRTITFSDPATRVRAGVVQVPGGKAVFAPLSVEENLKVGAYTILGDRRRVEAAFQRVVDLFPVLGDRMDQPAGTLSGGEQQMLGLAQALVLDPALLLIDELSLGLAPVVVQQLLEIVGRLKAEGMTMVIVEQSVNVALSIADRAVFMEKGQVRFEGPASELLERDDLIRAVFLGGEGG